VRPGEAVRAVVPQGLLAAAWTRQAQFGSYSAKRAFASASLTPEWLGAKALDVLESRFPPVADYSYEGDALDRRGAERARALLRLELAPGRTLEVGAGDGMVSYHLVKAGFRATALDLSPKLFDDRAKAAGVEFLEGDAAAIPADDDQFEMAFSYNSFEHFADPTRVLDEMIRITRPGGLVHLHFGPLYFSPYGLHGYRSIKLPYCHLLFERHVLEQYVEDRRLPPIPFGELNGWSVTRFRRLWKARDGVIERVGYSEFPQLPPAGHELIVRYPSCFRSKTSDFDDLFVATIRATFRVRAMSAAAPRPR
jgi:SAM-dependent methyltransferase